MSWEEGPDSASLANGVMLRIVSTSAGLIGLGTVNGDPAAWASPDGLSWTRLEPGASFAGGQITAATALGQRIFIFGKSGAGALVEAIGTP